MLVCYNLGGPGRNTLVKQPKQKSRKGNLEIRSCVMNVDKKLLGQLVCGSENINQMRQEIEMLVPMITSLCGRSRPDQEFELDQTIDAGDFYWQVHYRLGLELMKRSWWAQCFKKGCGEASGSATAKRIAPPVIDTLRAITRRFRICGKLFLGSSRECSSSSRDLKKSCSLSWRQLTHLNPLRKKFS